MEGSDDERSADESSVDSTSLSDLAARVADAGERGDDRSLSDLAESIRRRDETARETDQDGDDAHEEWDVVTRHQQSDTAEVTDPKTEAVLDLIGDESNVLLKGPADCAAEQSLCARLMTVSSEQPVNLLLVLIDRTASERLTVLQNYITGPVDEMAIVDVRTYGPNDADGYDGPADVHRIRKPSDLRRIGILMSKILTNWEERPGRTTVCFHSLSDHLDLVDDRPSMFRFLHILHGRIQSADARAHYHIDPDAHDDRVVQTFSSLFDTVLRFDSAGSVSLE